MDEILLNEAVDEAFSDVDTVETADVEIVENDLTPEQTEVTETENPVAEPLDADETITAEEIQGETAEPITDTEETVEDAEEVIGEESDPEDTPVIEEAVVPGYIGHAQEVGTRENPIFANGGREVSTPSLLQ